VSGRYPTFELTTTDFRRGESRGWPCSDLVYRSEVTSLGLDLSRREDSPPASGLIRLHADVGVLKRRGFRVRAKEEGITTTWTQAGRMLQR